MDVRALKDEAAELFRKGRFSKAAEKYAALAKAEPKDPQHLIKLGDSHRRDGRKEPAIEAYRKAVDDYARSGIVIKAIAACKLILEIDANQRDAQEALATLCSKRYVKRDQIDTPPPTPAARKAEPPKGRFDAIDLPDEEGSEPELETAGGETLGEPKKPELKLPPRAAPAAQPPPKPAAPPPPRMAPVTPPQPEMVESLELDLGDAMPVAAAPKAPTRPFVPPAPPPPEPEPEMLELDLGLAPEQQFPNPTERRRGQAIELRPIDDDEIVEELPLDAIEEVPLIAENSEQHAVLRIATEEAMRPATAMAHILSDALIVDDSEDDGDEIELVSVSAGMPTPLATRRPTIPLDEGNDADLTPISEEPPPPPKSSAHSVSAREREEMLRLANEAAFDLATPLPTEPEPEPEPVPEPEAAPGGDVEQASVPLFSELPREAFLELLERLEFRRIEEGGVILREGDPGKSIYVLASGKAKVVKGLGTPKAVELAVLDDGAFFGEMALLNGAPRVASVVAAEDSEVLELTEQLLRELTTKHPTVAQSLRKFYRQRLLANVMAISPLFRSFDKGDRKMLIEKFKLREAAANEPLLKEGEKPDGLYVVMHGAALVTKKDPKAARVVPLALLREGDVFGEISLLTKSKATATVTAKRKTLVLRLPKEAFDELIFTHPAVLEVVSELTDQRSRVTERILSGELEAPREALALV